MGFRSSFGLCFGCIPQRYLMGLMAFIGVAVSYMARNCLAMAITGMVKYRAVKNITESEDACPGSPVANKSGINEAGQYDWNENIQGHILGAFYWGYVITHLPGGILADIFGGKHVFGTGVVVTHITSLIIPTAAEIHYGVVIAVRIVCGLASGVIFPALNVLLARWIPKEERSTVGAVVFAGTQIGNVISNLLSGLIMHYTNWTVVFYFFGVIGIIWYLIFLATVTSQPGNHPFIKDDEKEFLETAIVGVNKEKPPLPVIRILLSCPVWALIICQFGHNWGLFTMQNDLPKYMHSVLKYSAKKNGVLSSLPYLAMWIVAIISGWISDFIVRKDLLSMLNNRKLLTMIYMFTERYTSMILSGCVWQQQASEGPTGSYELTVGVVADRFTVVNYYSRTQAGPGIFCLLAIYAGCTKWLVMTMFIVGMALMGPFYPSMRVNALDLSPNYAGFLMALINGLGSIAGSLCSIVIGVIVHKNSFAEWQLVFWISNIIITGTGIWYCIFAKANIQSWNDKDNKEET